MLCRFVEAVAGSTFIPTSIVRDPYGAAHSQAMKPLGQEDLEPGEWIPAWRRRLNSSRSPGLKGVLWLVKRKIAASWILWKSSFPLHLQFSSCQDIDNHVYWLDMVGIHVFDLEDVGYEVINRDIHEHAPHAIAQGCLIVEDETNFDLLMLQAHLRLKQINLNLETMTIMEEEINFLGATCIYSIDSRGHQETNELDIDFQQRRNGIPEKYFCTQSCKFMLILGLLTSCFRRSTGIIVSVLLSLHVERCELLESGSINYEKGEFSIFVLPLTIGGFMLWLKGRLIVLVLVLFAPALVY
ncbi:hypothetical protein RHSIM_Rhsim04G0036500 [Rhododendron simsii]|uniref:Uncharacterized protein n=1 Tax=Rhododendron simsii TaxID=118357 RepID=A0A834H7H9_RHOSS|nr:hypothetical protein RHSIM_Rhsim04G0036500 [Rhododendron simsii]